MPYLPPHIIATDTTKNAPPPRPRPIGVFRVRAQSALAVVTDDLPVGRRQRRDIGWPDLRGFPPPHVIFAAAAAFVVCLSAWIGLIFALFCLFL